MDTTIGVSEIPLGNLTYWFEGSAIYVTINLSQGMMNKPIGVYVNKTIPPVGPPLAQSSQVRYSATSFEIVLFDGWRPAMKSRRSANTMLPVKIQQWPTHPVACFVAVWLVVLRRMVMDPGSHRLQWGRSQLGYAGGAVCIMRVICQGPVASDFWGPGK
jgi:hypothetical protein